MEIADSPTLNDARLYPLSLSLYVFLSRPTSFGGGLQWNLLAAAAIVVTMPIVVLFFLAQRQFIEGITMTGVKG